MTYGTSISHKFTVGVAMFLVGAMLTSAAGAQGTPPPGYPAPSQPYPAGAAPMLMPPQQPMQPAQPQSHMIRDLFAGTLAAVLQTATGGLVGAVNGRLMDWFAKKGQSPAQGYASTGGYPPQQAYPSQQAPAYPSQQASAYPSQQTPGAYPSTPAYPATPDPAAAAPTYPTSATPAYPSAAAAYPSNTYPTQPADPAAAAQANAYQPGGYAPAPQVYDARTGQVASGAANPYAMPAASSAGTLYAGIAYEVHALSADGRSTPINAATYEFHTGDKFMVYYRPSLPGRMEVYNVNPAGQQTLIDAANMAAGQMTSLGPYQFANLKGDESLRLVLSPCSNPQLLAATRDIVRADATPQSMPQATSQYAPQMTNGVQLASCDSPTTRGLSVRTRDIQKVAVDGTTSFALDAVSQQERASGQVTPREATIVFHHR